MLAQPSISAYAIFQKQIAKQWQTLSTEHCMLNIYCNY